MVLPGEKKKESNHSSKLKAEKNLAWFRMSKRKVLALFCPGVEGGRRQKKEGLT